MLDWTFPVREAAFELHRTITQVNIALAWWSWGWFLRLILGLGAALAKANLYKVLSEGYLSLHCECMSLKATVHEFFECLS